MTVEPTAHPPVGPTSAFAWTPPPPPGPPPPGPPPPAAPPTAPYPPGGAPPPGGPPFGGPPPGAAGGPSRSRKPWGAIIAVVAVAVVLAIVGSAVVLVQARNRDEQRKEEEEREREAQALADDQDDLAAAIEEGDTEAVVRLVDDRPELLDEAEALEVGGPEEALDGGDLGYVAGEVGLEPDVEYVVDVTGAETDPVLLAPGEDEAQVVEGGTFRAGAAGRHTLLLAAGRGDEPTVALTEVRTEEFALTTDDTLESYTLEPGEVLDLTFDVTAGEVYEWGLAQGDVQVVLLDGAGAPVEATSEDGGFARFTPASDDAYRLRVTSDSPDPETFEVDAFQVAHYAADFGEEGDAVFLERVSEPDSFLPPGDDVARVWRFCLFVREGVEINYRINPSVAGATYDLNEFEGDGTTPLNTFEGVEGDLLEIGPTDQDVELCYEVVPTSPIPSSPSVTVVEV